MEKEYFEKLDTALKVRIEMCESFLHDIHTTDDLRKLTLDEAAKLIRFCRTEIGYMDKVCNSDIYHIIGMGNLTPPQMMQFTFALKDYLQYRSLIKTLAFNFDKITTLPGIPVTSKYKISLADLILSSGDGTTVQYESATGPDITGDLPFVLNEKEITVDLSRFADFLSIMSSIFNCGFSESTARSRITNLGEYMGVKWKTCSETEATGKFKSENMWGHVKAFWNEQLAQRAQ